MIDRVRAVGGYDLHFYNSTMENGIPSVLVLAKNRKKIGLNIIAAAGAHLDRLRAAKSAIQELAGMMLKLDGDFEANREEYLRMLKDSPGTSDGSSWDVVWVARSARTPTVFVR